MQKKNYGNRQEVVFDIVKKWQKFAVERFFEEQSFYMSQQVANISIRANSYTTSFTKENDTFLVSISEEHNQDMMYMPRGRVYRDPAHRTVINCELKDLHNFVSNDNIYLFLQVAKAFNSNYIDLIRRKEELYEILNTTISIGSKKVVKEFLLEKCN